jgi:DNA-binding transcriptional MerR regulator
LEQLVDKAPDAYRTISEVADDLDLPQHVLRFWETRFSQIKPLKRGGGRRYYRPEDIDLLKGIRHLLYGEGYTIRGVQRIIKESGIKAIQALGRGEGAAPPAKPKGPDIIAPYVEPEVAEPANAGLRASLKGLFRPNAQPGPVRTAPPLAAEGDPMAPAFGVETYGQRPFAVPRREEPSFHAEAAEDEPEEISDKPLRFPPPPGATERAPALPQDPVRTFAPAHEPAHATHNPMPAAARPSAHPGQAVETLPSRVHQPVHQPMQRPTPQLASEDVRRLQAALYELLECRKRLDQTFETR